MKRFVCACIFSLLSLGACTAALVIIRMDDAAETVKARLETYHRETEPLKDFYDARGKLVSVIGQPTVAETTDEIKKALELE